MAGTAFSITINDHPHTLHLLNPGNDEANAYTCSSCKFMAVGKRYTCKTCTPTYSIDEECGIRGQKEAAGGGNTCSVVVDGGQQAVAAAEVAGLVAANLMASAMAEGVKMIPTEAVEMAVPLMQGAAAIATLAAAAQADSVAGDRAAADEAAKAVADGAIGLIKLLLPK